MLARCWTGIISGMRPWLAVAAVVPAVISRVALWPRASKSTLDPCGPVTAGPLRTGVQAAGQATICLLNRERTSRGLPPLRENTVLDAASAEHSQDMVRRDYFEHTGTDGRSVGDRLRAVGYG